MYFTELDDAVDVIQFINIQCQGSEVLHKSLHRLIQTSSCLNLTGQMCLLPSARGVYIHDNKLRAQISNLCAQSIKLRAWIIKVCTQFFFYMTFPQLCNNQHHPIKFLSKIKQFFVHSQFQIITNIFPKGKLSCLLILRRGKWHIFSRASY